MSDGDPRDGDPDDVQDDSEPSVWDEIEEVAGDDPTPSDPPGEDSTDATDVGWGRSEADSSDDGVVDPNGDRTPDPTVIDEQSPGTDPEPESAGTDATVVDDQFPEPATEATDATAVEDQFSGSNPEGDATDATDATVVDDQFPGPDVDTSDAGGSHSETPTADDQLLDAEADTEDTDEMFEQRDVSAVDGESLWDELANTGSQGTVDEETGSSARESTVEQTTDAVEGDERGTESVDRDGSDGEEALIDKRAYCQQCPYFSDPPAVHCSHDGTTIQEVLEDGRFRVTGCPVVTETGPDRTILNDGS